MHLLMRSDLDVLFHDSMKNTVGLKAQNREQKTPLIARHRLLGTTLMVAPCVWNSRKTDDHPTTNSQTIDCQIPWAHNSIYRCDSSSHHSRPRWALRRSRQNERHRTYSSHQHDSTCTSLTPFGFFLRARPLVAPTISTGLNCRGNVS